MNSKPATSVMGNRAAVPTPAPVIHGHSNRAVLYEAPLILVLADSRDDEQLGQRARQVAQELSLPLAASPSASCDFLLAVTPDRIELRPMAGLRSKPVFVDWSRLDTASSAGRNRRQPIAKAVAAKNTSGRSGLHIVDATAGFGEDTWLLASLGYRVTAIERSPIVAKLLQDGLRRAKMTNPVVAQRITLITGDAAAALSRIDPPPDVVYLDPMFPPKQKSALGRKPIRLLRQLVGDDPDATQLFDIALQTARRRVVVKRPLHAPPLHSGPTLSHKGKSMRYDIYAKPGRGDTYREFHLKLVRP